MIDHYGMLYCGASVRHFSRLNNIIHLNLNYYAMSCHVMSCQSKIDEDTPFGRVARPFFCGSDDEFRNNRFKLIPKVRHRTAMALTVTVTPSLLYTTILYYTLLYCTLLYTTLVYLASLLFALRYGVYVVVCNVT